MISASGRSILFVALLAGIVRLYAEDPRPRKLSLNPVPANASPAPYILQPKDEITSFSVVVKELSDKHFIIDESGDVNFPLVGRLTIAGSTVAKTEQLLTDGLKTYYRDPDIALTVTSIRTQPVSVLGSVTNPGIQRTKGPVSLVEVISMAGGFRPDAGPTLTVTRRAPGLLPHSRAVLTPSGDSKVSLDIADLLAGKNAGDDILILPDDVISVPAAQVVYVVGNVKRAGGFTLSGRPHLSVVQALSLAEGLDLRAAPAKARILRRDSEQEEQIAVDLKQILAGKSEDVILHPNDILFVPSSAMKVITNRTIDTALQVGAGLLIVR